MLSVQKIIREYNHKSILNNITFSLLRGEKVGLVAPNGVGKSTLLKIIAGEDTPDSGSIISQKGTVLAYFPQEVCADVSISEYLEITTEKEESIMKLLRKVGLGEVPLNMDICKLSGGQRSKVAFVKILSTKADIYLLDEPTNNLDFVTLKLMEDFVVSSGSAFMIVSHDREFLDRTVEKIFEIDEFSHSLRIYSGGYSEYLKQYEARVTREWARYEDAQEKSKRMKKAVSIKMHGVEKLYKVLRNKRKLAPNITDKINRTATLDRAGKIARQGKVIKNRLESYNLDEIEKPKSRLPLKLNLEEIEPSGVKVFFVEHIDKTMGDKHIGPIDIDVQYGDKILILGDNGAGKTTLLKMILGDLTPDRGEIKRGTKLDIGYLPQITNDNQKNTALSFFLKYTPNKEESDARKILNRFNLTEKDANKTLNELSPGLRSRLVLATMMANKPNCLIFDEPSNHLDLEVLEKLEDALMQYSGTVILVSHDRRLIKKLKFTKIYNLSHKGVLEEVVNIDDI